MNRHKEVFDEISGILETEDYEPERFQEMCYELAEEIDELREVIRACAAGPWRTDVENAPKDGTRVLAEFERPDGTTEIAVAYWFKSYWRTTYSGFEMTNGCLRAFAIPNPPEVTG